MSLILLVYFQIDSKSFGHTFENIGCPIEMTVQALALIGIKALGIRIHGCGEVSITNKNKIEKFNKILIAFEIVNDNLYLSKCLK